jgi:hypothetical protein
MPSPTGRSLDEEPRMERLDPYRERVLHQNTDPNDATARTINENWWPQLVLYGRVPSTRQV